MDNMSLVENLIVFPLMGVGALTIICLAVGGAGLCIWKWCAKRAGIFIYCLRLMLHKITNEHDISSHSSSLFQN
jgi:hypothetical protein